MSDNIVKREVLEAFRSDWERLRHQRAKLEKIQKAAPRTGLPAR
jgi:hypothetical protein